MRTHKDLHVKEDIPIMPPDLALYVELSNIFSWFNHCVLYIVQRKCGSAILAYGNDGCNWSEGQY